MAPWQEVENGFSTYLLTTGRSKKTAITYCYNVRLYWHEMTEMERDPIRAEVDDIRSWVAHRRGRVSANKVRVDVMALRAFYSYVLEQCWRVDDPMPGIKAPREQLAARAPFAASEVNALIEASHSPRDKLLYRMLAGTGMRISEMLGLQIEDIDWERGLIKVRGKGSKQRWSAPSDELMAALKAYLKRRTAGYVWLTKYRTQLKSKDVRTSMKLTAKEAGIPDVHPHRFRTTFAHNVLHHSGGDIQAVQVLLGHESIDTTQRYTAYDKEQRALRLMRGLAKAS